MTQHRFGNFSLGFTFIELLVTIAILAMLTAISAVSFRGANRNSRDAQRKAQLQQIRGGIEEFRLDTGAYPPDNDTSSDGLFLSSLQPNYVGQNYLDPKNDANFYYQYRYVGNLGCPYVVLAAVENEKNSLPCPSACGIASSESYCLGQL